MSELKSHGWKFALFAVLCLAQLGVPGSMILKHERTLKQGEVFRIHCEPVDPVDLFRGRYVRIRLEELRMPMEGSMHDGFWNEPAFLSIEKDDEGFMKLVGVSFEEPAQGLYFKAKASADYRNREDGRNDLIAELPFDRFYMREDLAPKAERAYRRGETEAFVTIRVLNGFAALEELYLDGKPVAEFLSESLEEG